MMYASLSAYMHDKKNSVTLYSRTPTKSPSMSVAPNEKKASPKMQSKSLSMNNMGSAAAPNINNATTNNNGAGAGDALDVADIHAAVLASRGGREAPKRMHSLEEEMRDMEDKQADIGTVSVLSVETTTDSLLVKLLNYLKDHRVGIVKIRKENVDEEGDGRSATPSPKSGSPRVSTFSPNDVSTELGAEHREARTPAPSPEITSKEDSGNHGFNYKNDEVAPSEGAEQQHPTISIHHSDEKPQLRRQLSRYDVFVNLQEDGKRLNELLMQIEHQVGGVRYRRSKLKKQTNLSLKTHTGQGTEVSPGFPMRIDELDVTSKHVLMYGAELDAEHPGFKDPDYRKRRLMFGQVALNYRQGQPLPRVDYNDSEKQTWSTIFRELMRLYPTYACMEFNTNMQLLQQECLYSENDIPQLPDVSRFLKSRSGFQLRPVAGYLSPRDFLAGLAFRVFHTTQYIRHPSEPFYSPEPDCCHELLGHVPMLADPEFAQFSQEIGLASLGASEDDIKKLAILYFFTIEFGLCRDAPPPPKMPQQSVDDAATVPQPEQLDDKAQLRVYGAGLLSCVAELKHVLSDESNIKKFDTAEACQTECMITTFQETYFYNNSFREAVEDVRHFAEAIKKPFTVRYNPYTEALEIIDNVQRVERLISELRQDATILSAALRRLGYDGNLRHITTTAIEDLP